MLPYHSFISWSIGPITIQSFGLMMALGFLVAIYLFARSFKTEKEQEQAYNIGLLIILSGVIGSRIFFFIENPGTMTSIWDFFSVWNGGLSWFGGFFGALTACIVYFIVKKLNFWTMADKLAPSIAIGHAFGRLGCVLGDGGHVGKLTTMPWGFDVNGEIRHVTAWYEMIGLVALFITLLFLRKRKLHKGFLFEFYLVFYGALRFVSDFFRTDPTYLGLTASQYLSAALFLGGAALMLATFIRSRSLESRSSQEPKHSKRKGLGKEI